MSKKCRAGGWRCQESGRPLEESKVHMSDWGQRSECGRPTNGSHPKHLRDVPVLWARTMGVTVGTVQRG